jgi:general L-amino acid transport system permease protein
MASISYVRTEMEPAQSPPGRTSGAVAWVQKNLFATPTDTILTILGALFLFWIVPPIYGFFIGNAVPPGGTVEQCRVENVGACWAYIASEIEFFIYGFYPMDQYWRVNIVFALLAILVIPLLIPKVPLKIANAALFAPAAPTYF